MHKTEVTCIANFSKAYDMSYIVIYFKETTTSRCLKIDFHRQLDSQRLAKKKAVFEDPPHHNLIGNQGKFSRSLVFIQF